MQTEVKKWGNSLGVRLPRHITEGASLRDGTPIELSLEGDTVVLRPTRQKFKLTDLLKGHKKADENAEIEWGPAKGEEVW
ncbi:MAG: type II toxin-antitoxin system antidote component MazE [Oceanicaulis sp. HLUCCA04]|nr:MAG: type II toxin-antitoxin system antidote component MazE [Oceanicaulis sp. HLUCCA04]